MTRQVIGGREEETFQSFGLRVDVVNQGRVFCGAQEIVCGHELSGFQVVRDIEHGLAFTYGERLFEYLAIGELPKDVVSGGSVIEEIFAGLQGTARMATGVKFKGNGAADNTFSLEKACDAATG